MNPDPDEARVARERERLEHGFHGEEEDASTPRKDILAAIAIGAFAVAVMVLAAQQPNPGRILTAPGLLPFITGLTLLAMAIGLALGAWREGGGSKVWRAASPSPSESDSHPGRAWALFGLLVAWVGLIDLLPFELSYPLGHVEIELGSFECITIPILAAVLRIFWRASPARCVLAAALGTLVFASAFRYGFNIPLPGSG